MDRRGRFPGEQGGSGGHEADGSGSDTESSKKKSKKSSDSSRPRFLADLNPESLRKNAEKERISKALAEFFVMRDEETKPKPEHEHKKKKEESAPEPVAQELIDPTTHEVAPQISSRTREDIERAHNKPESDDDDDESEPSKKSDEKLERKAEREEDKASRRQWLEFDLPLNEYDDKEIELPLEGETIADEAAAEPESAPVAEAAPEFAPLELEAVPERPPRVSVAGPLTGSHGRPEQPRPAPVYVAPEAAEQAAFIEPESAPVTPDFVSPVEEGEIVESGLPMVPVTAEANRRLEPAEAYRMYVERQAAQHRVGVAPGEEVVSKQAAEEAEYYAARAGQSRGFVTGLFVAGVWGHFRRKGLKKQFNKVFKHQEKQISQLREDQHFYNEAQQQRQAEDERRLAATQRQLTTVERQLHGKESNQLKQPELQVSQPGYKERPVPHRQDPEVVEQLNVPAEHRLETSAWHTIEIDTRTGRPVEQPSFAYGHEYYQERAHEAPPVDQRNAAAGEVVLAAMSVDSSQPQAAAGGASNGGYSPIPPADLPSATRQGPPAAHEPSKDWNARNPLPGALSSSGPIWPFVLTLVVIFICLLFLL